MGSGLQHVSAFPRWVEGDSSYDPWVAYPPCPGQLSASAGPGRPLFLPADRSPYLRLCGHKAGFQDIPVGGRKGLRDGLFSGECEWNCLAWKMRLACNLSFEKQTIC